MLSCPVHPGTNRRWDLIALRSGSYEYMKAGGVDPKDLYFQVKNGRSRVECVIWKEKNVSLQMNERVQGSLEKALSDQIGVIRYKGV